MNRSRTSRFRQAVMLTLALLAALPALAGQLASGLIWPPAAQQAESADERAALIALRARWWRGWMLTMPACPRAS